MKKIIASIICMAMILSMASCGIKDQPEQIVDFECERDLKDILKIIQDDWNWLFTYPSHYDPTYVLQNEIPNKDLLTRKNTLKMKVLRKGERAKGLVTFYKDDSDSGRIRLVSVAQEFRDKGYDKILTSTATNTLFNLGCTSVYLYTHKENEKMSAYESLGFKKVEMDQESLVYFKEKGIPADDYIKFVVTKETFKP